MKVGFGGNPVFNRASPSSHDRCVTKIVEDYLPHGGRVLDIGGTDAGFRNHAALPAGCTVVIANPEHGVGADYKFVAEIPMREIEPFDLAMLFGVAMYIREGDLVELMRDIRSRLRHRGWLLIAEPNPEGAVGKFEVAAKSIYAAIRSLWNPTNFTFYTMAQTTEMLRTAGFTQIRDRTDLTPNRMGVFPPPMPAYYVIAARV